MTTANHTPGPWHIAGGPSPIDGAWGVSCEMGNHPIVADVFAWNDADEIDAAATKANAHLIAAAPDMLEVLEFINKWFRNVDSIDIHTYCDGEPLDTAIQRAIAKARGEQQE